MPDRALTFRWLRWIIQTERAYWLGEYKLDGGLNGWQADRWNKVYETAGSWVVEHIVDPSEQYVKRKYGIEEPYDDREE